MWKKCRWVSTCRCLSPKYSGFFQWDRHSLRKSCGKSHQTSNLITQRYNRKRETHKQRNGYYNLIIKIVQEWFLHLQLIGVQKRYRDLLNKNWEESRVFYKRKLEEVNEMKEHKVRLISEGKLKEAQLIEEEMSEKLVTEFVPKTTIWYQYCSFQFYNEVFIDL